MFKKLIYLILLFKLSEARYGFVPKFYGQDSAVIVDTDKTLPQTKKFSLNYPTKLRLPPPFPMWQHFPRYHIIPAPSPGQLLAINAWSKNQLKPTVQPTTSSSTSTTTTAKPTVTSTTAKPTTTSTAKPLNTNSKYKIDTVPFVTGDEFPKELLKIAQTKLGLKSLEEIPSISELGQLLGTNGPHETLAYIKKLTSNEQGVALLRAYIESTDYTDSAAVEDSKANDYDEITEDLADIEEPLKINDEGLVVISDEDSNDDYEENDNDEQEDIKVTEQPRKAIKTANKPGLMERISNFMHLNNLWAKKANARFAKQSNKEILIESSDEAADSNELNRLTIDGKRVETTTTEATLIEDTTTKEQEVPILVRDAIPYNYPVPLRPKATKTDIISTTSTPIVSAAIASSSDSNVVHLNTPKMLMPHVQQLARVTKIPPKKIEDFLASKPKLLELANKVSRFPIGYDRTSPLEAQVMAAVQRAIEQDDDLKKLLSSTTTLK